MKFKEIFRDERHLQLFHLLLTASVFGVLMVLFRLRINIDGWYFPVTKNGLDWQRGPMFLFLIWNLFLAWIPYFMAQFLRFTEKKGKISWKSIGLLGAWLLFFPNAPYLLTDLLHLRPKPPVPHWYDLILLFSFACTGLMLGLLSLYEVQKFLRKHFAEAQVWAATVGIAFMGGFGVWLGRYQRWNSWDIVVQPFSLIKDTFYDLHYPTAFAKMVAVSLLLTVFLLMGHLVLLTLLGERKAGRD